MKESEICGLMHTICLTFSYAVGLMLCAKIYLKFHSLLLQEVPDSNVRPQINLEWSVFKCMKEYMKYIKKALTGKFIKGKTGIEIDLHNNKMPSMNLKLFHESKITSLCF